MNKLNRINRFFPFIILSLLIVILSFRQLSDHDLGFHLKYGKWIMENRSIPIKDISTYTVNNRDYIDLHWLFQVFVYILYTAAGYKGLTILVTLLTILLLFLLYLRNSYSGIPLNITCIVFLYGFLIIEPRLVLRPELFTFQFITIMLILLDLYYNTRKNLLFLLPVIMLFWCNMHSLFVLGFVLIGAYFISIGLRDKKADGTFIFWALVSAAVCFLNPYFGRGFIFPIDLLTRFGRQNIFNSHIWEFKSLLNSNSFETKDILFIIFSTVTFSFVLITARKRKIHEFILILLFACLAFIAIRNVALFVLVAAPILSNSLNDTLELIRYNQKLKVLIKKEEVVRQVVIYGMIFICIAIIPRLLTNSYYVSNNAITKTGIGIDTFEQPVLASIFLNHNRLNGRILNGVSMGGWLSWSIQQPVFIDGRLEVIGESFYEEVVGSWTGGLSTLIARYRPKLIVYNYQQYYPWTVQLSSMPEWRLIYLDGVSAIFAQDDYAENMPDLEPRSLPGKYNFPEKLEDQDIRSILNLSPPKKLITWLEGFYKKTDYSSISILNIASFCLQMRDYKTAELFFLEYHRRTNGSNTFIYYALADIFKSINDKDKALLCYQRILQFDPKNRVAATSLQELTNIPSLPGEVSGFQQKEIEAITSFNEGNQKFQNGNINAAITEYNKAIRLKPDYYKAYNNLGILYASALENYIEARKNFDKAIEIKPDYSDAWLGRGTSRYHLRDYQGACQDWDKAKSLGNMQAAKMIGLYCK